MIRTCRTHLWSSYELSMLKGRFSLAMYRRQKTLRERSKVTQAQTHWHSSLSVGDECQLVFCSSTAVSRVVSTMRSMEKSLLPIQYRRSHLEQDSHPAIQRTHQARSNKHTDEGRTLSTCDFDLFITIDVLRGTWNSQ